MSYEQDSEQESRSSLNRGYVLLGIFALLLLASAGGAVYYFQRTSHMPSDRVRCQNNLKQLGIVLHMYCNEHNGAWPKSLADLYPEYTSDLKFLMCPTVGTEPGAPEDVTKWSSYFYTPYDRKSDPFTTVVCGDKEEVHMPGGRNELFADGHVEFTTNRIVGQSHSSIVPVR